MSHGLPILKARDVARIVKKLGFIPVRQRGSHLFFMHPDGRNTLVPVHGGEDIGRGLLAQILREIQLSQDELASYL